MGNDRAFLARTARGCVESGKVHERGMAGRQQDRGCYNIVYKVISPSATTVVYASPLRELELDAMKILGQVCCERHSALDLPDIDLFASSVFEGSAQSETQRRAWKRFFFQHCWETAKTNLIRNFSHNQVKLAE